MREVLIVAGEASGDLHAGAVAEELRRRRSDLPLAGIGGDHMERAGVHLLERADRLAVMGFVEVLRHVPRHLGLLRTLRRRLRSGRVALVILLDYPGFNLKLASVAARARVPVLYYITPQVWAWHAARLAKMARVIKRAAVILPFEEALLRAHGIDATFVGHPLLDRAQSLPSRAEARLALGLPPDGPVLALFPGSRAQEIARHLEDFIAVGRELERRIPGLRTVVSVAPTVEIDPSRSPFPLVRSSSFPVLCAADAAFCKSGTTTLEAAVAGCPLAVGYRANALTYALARHLVRIPHIALVNVVAGREVTREFVQDGLRPAAVAAYLEPLLDPRDAARARMLAALADVRSRLGTPGAAQRVAAMALEMMP